MKKKMLLKIVENIYSGENLNLLYRPLNSLYAVHQSFDTANVMNLFVGFKDFLLSY